MAFVRTFRGYRPAPREDGVKWTFLDIFESASSQGAWDVPIDTQPIPDYADASAPPTLSFTTDDAQLESAWYRIRFRDAGAGESWTTPEAFGTTGVTLPPSAADMRSRSAYLQQSFPVEPVDAEREERLREGVLDAMAIVESLTCRDLSSSLGDARLDRLAVRAVQLKAERLLFGEATGKARRGQLGGVRLRSFSAGPYSETYFGPEEAGKAGVLDLDPALHEVLWQLATPECRARWLYLWGKAAPEPWAGVQSFAYGRRGRRL